MASPPGSVLSTIPKTPQHAIAANPFSGDDTSGSSYSGLFDLGIRDASGFDADYRGPIPLGHHGESETYFVVIDERDVAFDHKYKAAYNALTYLLVDAGERPPDTQMDALTMANCSLRGDTPNERVSFPTTIRFPGAHFGTSPLTTATANPATSKTARNSRATPTTTLSTRSKRSTVSILDASRSAPAGAGLPRQLIPPRLTSCSIPKWRGGPPALSSLRISNPHLHSISNPQPMERP